MATISGATLAARGNKVRSTMPARPVKKTIELVEKTDALFLRR